MDMLTSLNFNFILSENIHWRIGYAALAIEVLLC